MKKSTEFLFIQRETAGDDHATLVAWLVGDGAEVKQGDPVCTVEMSKTEIDLEAPGSGWLFHLHQIADEVSIGSPVAIVSDKPERPTTQAELPTRVAGAVKISRKSQALIDEHGLTMDKFEGLEIVRERDVQRILGETALHTDRRQESDHVPLTQIQRSVARTVSMSHKDIPHSYLSHWVPADSCDARLKSLSAAYDITASVADLLSFAAVKSASTTPKANAAWGGDEILSHTGINLGFALNLEGGDLLVPVIMAANELEFDKLVASIRSLQVKARRKSLVPRDLAGATLTVTSLIGSGAQQVLPLILPETSVILAIGDKVLGPMNDSYCLTLGFDHRVLNGSEAAQYLASVVHEMTADADT